MSISLVILHNPNITELNLSPSINPSTTALQPSLLLYAQPPPVQPPFVLVGNNVPIISAHSLCSDLVPLAPSNHVSENTGAHLLHLSHPSPDQYSIPTVKNHRKAYLPHGSKQLSPQISNSLLGLPPTLLQTLHKTNYHTHELVFASLSPTQEPRGVPIVLPKLAAPIRDWSILVLFRVITD